MNTKSIGDVRLSQVITTFGPGAIVDLQTLSVIVAGIDSWPTNIAAMIHEPRLEQALKVKGFFSAMPSEGGLFHKTGTIPTFLFPRYQVCPVCRTLSCIGEEHLEVEPKWQEIRCKAPGCRGRGKYRAATLPAPFIVTCPSGHIDDFPWRAYVHKGQTSCQEKMTLDSIARTGAISDIYIKCGCGEGRSASDAFSGELRSSVLGPCTRKRPWLGIGNEDPSACRDGNNVRAMQRGATNVWFPVVRSALAIRERATPIGSAISACNPEQIARISSVESLRQLVDLEMFPQLKSFPIEEVWQTIQKMRGEARGDEIDLRWPEWTAFREPSASRDDRAELVLEQGKVPTGFTNLIEKVILARKLLEVRALVGFTRVEAMAAGGDDGRVDNIAPLSKEATGWLPGIEVRGEGIFIELSEAAVAAWEARPAVRQRAKAMSDKFREWERERGASPSIFPGARYTLLHSLAHSLIRQASLDCGYSASSIRERVYSSSDERKPMAGILLYTASPDSEGSLGGLVDLGSARRFSALLRNALRSTSRCSSDPLCADHQPDAHGTINAAACHACILAAETSCEGFNRFLDRNFLVPTMAEDRAAFFEGFDL